MRHLGYCSNIHPGESWSEVRRNLHEHLPNVKARVSPDARFGFGLRLSARAARELSEPGECSAFAAWLAEQNLYVFTINGFPYGSFHGTRVKEEVYRPDWLENARLDYSNRLAELLAALLPDDLDMGTVSTVPGAFKPRAVGEDTRIAAQLIAHAGELTRIEERTGKRIVLALEPEPCCQLETVAETIAFFEEHLFRRTEVVRRHLGVCFDACHMAVEFEGMAAALEAFARAGILVPKAQISAGLELPAEAPIDALARFDEPVYLHQVVEEGEDGLRRWIDLGDAFAAARGGGRRGRWRVHFHVPLFHEMLGELASTRGETAAFLRLLARYPDTQHLEVETYTWDVLPAEHRALDIDEAIARELSWTHAELGSGGA